MSVVMEPAQSVPNDPEIARGRGWTLAVACLGVFLLLLDLTVVNVALPEIRGEFGASFTQLQWVLDAYALGLAAFLVGAGSLADRLGRREVFMVGFAIFVLASLACGLAGNPTILILARLVQGLGGAVLFAVGPALVGHVYRGKDRAKAFAIFGGVGGLAIAFGPLIGGGLTDALSWRAIFLINIPVGLIALLVCATRVIRSRAAEKNSIDIAGMILASLALGALVLGLLQGERLGWGSAEIVGLFVGSVLLFAGFVWVQVRKGPRALFDATLFRNRTFNGLNVVTLLGNIAVMSAIFLFITYVQGFLGYSAWDSGLRFLVMTLALFIGALIAGPLAAKVPYRLVFAVAMALVGGGLLLVRLIDPSDGWTASIPLMLVLGLGMGLFNPPRAALSVSTTSAEKAGVASGVNETFQQVGVAIGIAGIGAFFHNRTIAAFEEGSRAILPDGVREQVAQAIPAGGGDAAIAQLPSTGQAAIAHIADAAFVDALHQAFTIGGVIALVAAVIAVATIRQRDLHPDATGY